MNIDNKTLEDLSIFHREGGVFSLIDKCETLIGSHWLKQHCKKPPTDYESLLDIHHAVAYWTTRHSEWCANISNGTVVMTEKFFHSAETITSRPSTASLIVDNIMRKVLPKSDASFIEFSIKHIIDFVKGCAYLVSQHLHDSTPTYLKNILDSIRLKLDQDTIIQMLKTKENASYNELAILSYHTRRYLKGHIEELLNLYAVIDGLRAMAVACIEHNWVIPELMPASNQCFKVESIYHPLIPDAISYNIDFSKDSNFLFLTGANMSGKSTLIRSIGIAAYLAHLGMGVPAKRLKISYMNNLISNMQVEDNLFKGESYFYAEVLRMKQTAERIVATDYNLVLMDELFKGTNVHDAYECTREVINALLTRKNNIYALSTHLYELYEPFKEQELIQFRYCATHYSVEEGYKFLYELRAGVSNDRIGYWVLKNEGVIDILYQK